MEAQEQRKLLSALCHGAIFFSSTFVSVIIPIVILSVTSDSVVKQNAKEAINFHINLYIYAAICFFLIFVLIGFPLLIILGFVSLIMPIIAILQVLSEPDQPYRYPLIFRLV
ncbi:DUF4870 domain-containing protein [Microseira wollei]|uniref:DUF4870 domain-containing protein n=1 Tax=Microseira wollei NIES-4236 TaxID=2530354 RepID=A0AAV3XAH9_9CYAN|nr:DUF4870 domain-containing protein [Microseira wollei]GET39244.1 hypothetical protein MiSe_40080 [Microseira wollei NIES-4236]